MEPWDVEPDVPQTPDAQASATATAAVASTAAEVAETFNWMSRYRETLSAPELTDEEKTIFLIWLVSFVTLCVYVLEHQCPAVGDEMQRIDATIGGGMFLFALLSLVLLKRE